MTNLNQREREVLGLLSEGLAFNEIAKKMKLSPRTVGFLVAELKCKIEKVGGSLEEMIDKCV